MCNQVREENCAEKLEIAQESETLRYSLFVRWVVGWMDGKSVRETQRVNEREREGNSHRKRVDGSVGK